MKSSLQMTRNDVNDRFTIIKQNEGFKVKKVIKECREIIKRNASFVSDTSADVKNVKLLCIKKGRLAQRMQRFLHIKRARSLQQPARHDQEKKR